MRWLVLCFVTLATFPAAASSVWLAAYTTTGLDEGEQARLRDQLHEELEAAGAKPSSEPPDATCATSSECVRVRLQELDVAAALQVDLVRAGPLLQVTTVLHVTGRADPSRGQRLVQLADLERGAPLLDDAVLAGLREATPGDGVGAGPPDEDEERDAAGPAALDEPDEALKEPAPLDERSPDASAGGSPTATVDDNGVPLLAVSGVALAAGGLVTLVTGATVATGGNGVLLDPRSSASDKALATVYGPLAIAAAVAGGAAVVAGGGLLVFGVLE